MYSLLLKKAIPFALTFVIGSFVGGLFQKSQAVLSGSFILQDEVPDVSLGRVPHSRSGCKHSRGRYLVAESKPLTILFKPDARWPGDFKPDASWPGEFKAGYKFPGAWVRVTFGADGKVQQVEPSDKPYPSLGAAGDKVVWERMERAARQIQFEPEMTNGLPVTVTREVEIRFMDE